jgi:methylated-DNA-[protein]-cysteine S-methyltransferase
MSTDQQVAGRLSPAPTDTDLAFLRERLAAAADREDLLDVAYRTVDSPVGSLLLATTPLGLVRVAFALEDHDRVLDALADAVSPRVLQAPARTDEVARQLDDYFAGRRRSFDLPLDLRLVRGFRRTVVESLPTITYGTTRSYADVAAAAGNPGAVRAVGSACSHNPIPLVVPCHRVVRSDGTIGAYLGGTDVKRALLDLEAGADR